MHSHRPHVEEFTSDPGGENKTAEEERLRSGVHIELISNPFELPSGSASLKLQLMTLTVVERIYGVAMSFTRCTRQMVPSRSAERVMLAGRGPPCPHLRREVTADEAIEGSPGRTLKPPHPAAGSMIRRSGLLALD